MSANSRTDSPKSATKASTWLARSDHDSIAEQPSLRPESTVSPQSGVTGQPRGTKPGRLTHKRDGRQPARVVARRLTRGLTWLALGLMHHAVSLEGWRSSVHQTLMQLSSSLTLDCLTDLCRNTAIMDHSIASNCFATTQNPKRIVLESAPIHFCQPVHSSPQATGPAICFHAGGHRDSYQLA